jgi:hypothetical protein
MSATDGIIDGAATALAPATGGASLALAAVPEVYKLITGLKQKAQGDALAKTPRPQYQVPSAISEDVANNQSAYGNYRIPGQDYYSGQVQASAAAKARALIQSGASPGALLQGISASNGDANDAFEKMLAMSGEQHQKNAENLSHSLENAAPYEDNAWSWNKQQPYVQAMREAQADNANSQGNIEAGLKGLSGVGIKALSPTDPTTKTTGTNPFLSGIGGTSGSNGTNVASLLGTSADSLLPTL